MRLTPYYNSIILVGMTLAGQIYGYTQGGQELYSWMGFAIGSTIVVSKCIFCD